MVSIRVLCEVPNHVLCEGLPFSVVKRSRSASATFGGDIYHPGEEIRVLVVFEVSEKCDEQTS